MTTRLNLATESGTPPPPQKRPPREYVLVAAVVDPEPTTHLECGCRVGLGKVGNSAILLDTVDTIRNDDGSLTAVLDVHDCDRARARAEGRPYADRRSDAFKKLTRDLADRMTRGVNKGGPT